MIFPTRVGRAMSVGALLVLCGLSLNLPLSAYAQQASATPLAPSSAAAAEARSEHNTRPAGDSTDVLRLDDLLRGLRTASPALRAARLEAEADAEQTAQVSALPDPTAGVVYQPYPVLTARGAQRTQWRVEQSIPFPGKRALRADAAALGAEVTQHEAETLAQDLALRIKEAYYDLYAAQAERRLVRDFRAQLADFEEAAATRYEVGDGSQQAILKAQIEHGRLGVRLSALNESITSARQALAGTLNRPASSLQGRAVVDTMATPRALGDGLQAALTQRPEAQARRARVQQAEEEVALARRAFYPDFSVSATYFDIAERDVPASATGRDALALGVGIKVPLWRGRLKANVREARLRQQQAEAQYEALEATLRTQLDDLSRRLRERREQLALLEQTLIPQAETTLEATLSAYSAGRTDFLDLLDAERTLFQLQTDRIATHVRYLKARAALARALGNALTTEYR